MRRYKFLLTTRNILITGLLMNETELSNYQKDCKAILKIISTFIDTCADGYKLFISKQIKKPFCMLSAAKIKDFYE